jgi:hypothetical protein
VRHSGLKGKKVQLTYALTSNADGLEKLPPLIIGKALKPRVFKNKTGGQLGFYYRANAKAWMMANLYQEWISDWDRRLREERRHVLLLQDNFSGHIPPEGLTNICVENFEPNLTAHIQPMDQGIIQCFKSHYRVSFDEHTLHNYEAGTTPSGIYDIDHLTAMRLAHQAWLEVDTTTIRNCWCKANILPEMGQSAQLMDQPSLPISALIHHQEDPIVAIEKQLASTLDELEQAGVLQRSNRIDISELLNPPDEAFAVSKATDMDIFEAVMEAKQVQEDTNGHIDDDNTVEPDPMQAELLQAVLLITRYTKDKDNTYLRKVDSVMASFAWQTHTLGIDNTTQTKITSYFSQ